jgi:hypothetical protein
MAARSSNPFSGVTLRGGSSAGPVSFKWSGKVYKGSRDLIGRNPSAAVALYKAGADALVKANGGPAKFKPGTANAILAHIGREVRKANQG